MHISIALTNVGCKWIVGGALERIGVREAETEVDFVAIICLVVSIEAMQATIERLDVCRRAIQIISKRVNMVAVSVEPVVPYCRYALRASLPLNSVDARCLASDVSDVTFLSWLAVAPRLTFIVTDTLN